MIRSTMYQKDYILRMIEMLGDLLRAIFGWIGKGKLEEAGDKINEAYLTFLRKDAGFFHRIPEADLTTVLLSDHHYTHGHLEVLAGLMHAEGALHEAKGDKEAAVVFFRKSLRVYGFLEENDRTWSEARRNTMDSLRETLRRLEEGTHT
jgi:hypothetical protein